MDYFLCAISAAADMLLSFILDKIFGGEYIGKLLKRTAALLARVTTRAVLKILRTLAPKAAEAAIAKIPEIREGWVPAELATEKPPRRAGLPLRDRFFDGSDPRLRFDTFVGGETIRLENLHASASRLELVLADPPRMVLELPDQSPATRVLLWVGTRLANARLDGGDIERCRHAVEWPR